MKVYLASSWRNEAQPAVVEALRKAGHEVYDFRNPAPGNTGFAWSSLDPDWQTWDAVDQINALAHPIACAGFALDFDAMKWADVCVMLQPCGRSAALELGWCAGAGKTTIVVFADGQEPELMLSLAQWHVASLDSLVSVLEELEGRRSHG